MRKILFHSVFFIYLLLSFNFSFAQKNEKSPEKGVNTPYLMGFENEEDWSTWLSVDVNGDGSTWVRHTDAYQSSSNTGDYAMRYYGSETVDANDWVFSPKINLVAGKVYAVQFWVKPGGEFFHEKLTVQLGTSQTVSAMTTTLWQEELCAETYKSVTLPVTPTATGEYVIGFWCHSNKLEHYVAIDDFYVSEAGFVTGFITDGTNPVEGARVEVAETDVFTISDATGSYTLYLPQGEYKIKASKPGFSSALKDLSVLPNFATTKNFVIVPLALDVPYKMSFEHNEAYHNWHIVNANGDVKAWFRETQFSYANTGASCMRYVNHYTNTADDWLISPKFNLTTGTTYLINFHVSAEDLLGTIIPELLTCKMGTEQTIAAMSTELWSETVDYADYRLIKLHVTPSTDGQYAFGFLCHSPENTLSLCLDDFSIGISGSLSGVVTDGNNPVEGVTIQINGTTLFTTTNAAGAYQFEELVADTYTLSTRKEGYAIATETVTLVANMNTVQDFIIMEMPLTPPYSMGFENTEEYQFWTTIDADNNNNTWFRDDDPTYVHTGDYCMRYNGINVTANDWLVSPKFYLTAGEEYTLTFFTRSYGGYDNVITLYMGTEPTVEALTTELWEEVFNSYTHVENTVTVTVPATGEYVFGFWVHSAPQRRCFIDDFSIVSQNGIGAISGYVTDGINPLEGVLIEVAGTTRTAVTDAAGTYELPNIPAGIYTLTASKTGYEISITDATVVENTVTQVDFILSSIPADEFMYIVRISSNAGASVAAANVTLICQDGDPNHIYQAVSGVEGVVFPEIWKETYDLKITLADHDDYIANDLEITNPGLEHTALLIKSVVGINENTLDNCILFPNPVCDLLTVKRPESTKVIVAVYNSAGVLVHSFKTSNTELKINLSGYNTGHYLIRISDDKACITKSFIKQ